MKLLLRSDVDGVGKRGDIVDVADGFARNYLMPQGKAITANAGLEAQAERMRSSRKLKDAADRSAAEEIARVLVAATITLTARAGEEGKLFGSVTSSEIVEAVEAQTGARLDRRHLTLPDAIKSLGTHTAIAKLHSDVQFSITVEVVPA